MTVVYLDSVFLFNALIDYLLVLAAARLAGIPLHRGRYAFCGRWAGFMQQPFSCRAAAFWRLCRLKWRQGCCWRWFLSAESVIFCG